MRMARWFSRYEVVAGVSGGLNEFVGPPGEKRPGSFWGGVVKLLDVISEVLERVLWGVDRGRECVLKK